MRLDSVMFKVRKHGEEIGLVIDLTATDRYYDPREWTERGVEYAKIKCMGHTAHGQEENIRRFFDTVTAFLTQNADNSMSFTMVYRIYFLFHGKLIV